MSIHSDSAHPDISKAQYPNVVARDFVSLTSMSGVIPNLSEQGEEENELNNDSFASYWGDRQVLPSLEIIPDRYVTSHLDDDFDADEVLSRSKSDEGNIEGSTLVLSAEELKYVLVGMRIAMNGG